MSNRIWSEMTENERYALRKFKAQQGPDWKHKLLDMWCSQKYRGTESIPVALNRIMFRVLSSSMNKLQIPKETT